MKKLSSLILSSLLIISLVVGPTASAQSPEIQDQKAVYHETNIIEIPTPESDLPIEITPFGKDSFSEITLPQGSHGMIGPMYTISAGTRIIFQVNLTSPNSSERFLVQLFKAGDDSPVYESSTTAARNLTASYNVTTSARYYLTISNLSAVKCSYNGFMSF